MENHEKMKVLWVTNTLFPEVCEYLKIDTPVIGGWMYSSALELIKHNPTIELGVISLGEVSHDIDIEVEKIRYFVINANKLKKNSSFYQIAQDFKPDIIHIHGTEYGNGIYYLTSKWKNKVILSIQGLVHIYCQYYLGGLKLSDVIRNITFRDIIRGDNLLTQQKNMQHRAAVEVKMLKDANHVIGRTYWDKAHVWKINANCNYHFCNETLRNNFYESKWDSKNINLYSIFLSQSHYPIKGLHKMLLALPLILNEFPETKVYIAGSDLLSKNKIRRNGYASFIVKLLSKYNLMDKIIFTGELNSQEMAERYLKSHVFVCPSIIENSPNSVGEAQILGVPCISADVGGVKDMISHEKTGILYRFEEYAMLAKHVCDLFADNTKAQFLSDNGYKAALLRHDRAKNAKLLTDIYNKVNLL